VKKSRADALTRSNADSRFGQTEPSAFGHQPVLSRNDSKPPKLCSSDSLSSVAHVRLAKNTIRNGESDAAKVSALELVNVEWGVEVPS